MRALRILVAVPFALTISLALFLLMHQLIAAGRRAETGHGPAVGVRFGKVVIPDEIVTRSRRKPEQPPPPRKPPPPPRLRVSGISHAPPLPLLDLPRLDVPLVGGEGLFIGNFQQMDRAAEGDVVPVVVIRPLYPREAALAGIEGWVKVEFTITETGTVEDPLVVESQPPRVFDREAIRAILKWKFKPRVVEGTAVDRRATQVIDFTLDDSRR